MDTIHEARTLLSDYNRWRLQTAAIERRRLDGQFVRTFKENKERLDLFASMASWCRARKLDPRLWIYLLFRSRRWTYAPQMVASHLMSEKMVARYDRLASRALDGYRKHILDAYEKEEDRYDPNWQLSNFSESLKKTYASHQDHQRCMRETVENTLGFHPKSATCLECPLRTQCADQLRKLIPEFDLIALREGKISPATAQAAVRAAND